MVGLGGFTTSDVALEVGAGGALAAGAGVAGGRDALVAGEVDFTTILTVYAVLRECNGIAIVV